MANRERELEAWFDGAGFDLYGDSFERNGKEAWAAIAIPRSSGIDAAAFGRGPTKVDAAEDLLADFEAALARLATEPTTRSQRRLRWRRRRGA